MEASERASGGLRVEAFAVRPADLVPDPLLRPVGLDAERGRRDRRGHLLQLDLHGDDDNDGVGSLQCKKYV